MKCKKMKRVLALVVASVLSCSILAGCGDDWLEDEDWTVDEFAISGDVEIDDTEEDTAEVDDAETDVAEASSDYGTGYQALVGKGTPDEDPNRKVRMTRAVRNFTKYDRYGNQLGDAFFPYRAMLSDNNQKAYDFIYNNIAAGKSEFDMGVVVSSDDIMDIFNAVYNENPELFWIQPDYGWCYNGQNQVTSFNVAFYDINNAECKNQFKNAAEEILCQAETIPSEAGKIKYVHDQLTARVDYVSGCAYNQSAYSALVNDQTVCSGYSRSFQYLMQQLGIPCSVIIGDANGAHSWNLVKCESVDYNVDVTWDDPIGNPAGTFYTTYLLVSDAQLSSEQAHIRDAQCSKLPAANYNYSGEFDTAVGDVSPVSDALNGRKDFPDSSEEIGGEPDYEDYPDSWYEDDFPVDEETSDYGDYEEDYYQTVVTADGAFDYIWDSDEWSYDEEYNEYYLIFDNDVAAYYSPDYEWYYIVDQYGTYWEYSDEYDDFICYQ